MKREDAFGVYRELREAEELAYEQLEDFNRTPEEALETLDVLDEIYELKKEVAKILIITNK